MNHLVSSIECTADKAQALRIVMCEQGLDFLIVPHSDEYQNEFIAPYAERLAWLTDFTGSAGVALLAQNELHLFVDGRYFDQAKAEVDAQVVQCHLQSTLTHTQCLENLLTAGRRLAIDPWLHVPEEVERLQTICCSNDAELIFVKENIIDTLWDDQPKVPLAAIVPHPLKYAGESSAEKRHKITEQMLSKGQDAFVISATDSIAWLLNVRGDDIQITPLPFSLLILYASGHVDYFVRSEKIGSALSDFLDDVSLCDNDFKAALIRLGQAHKNVAIDPMLCPLAIGSILKEAGATVLYDRDPCQRPKAIKNAVEIAGARQAHVYDGLSHTRFMHWISTIKPEDNITEIDAAQKLTDFRRLLPEFQSMSFPVISAYGPNGALPHYLPNEKTNRLLGQGSLYLVDSGGQYFEGTTDVTRMAVLGNPTNEMIKHYTLVLKGHIALATTQFPEGTCGMQLDCLSRHALWQEGLNFSHGTGHGVGSYLGIHEGPQSISATEKSKEILQSGMLVTNEPGYYRVGHYGIRIENIMLIKSVDTVPGAEQTMLCFETLTLVPLELKLVAVEMLTEPERHWLNNYHSRVREAHESYLNDEEKCWLLDVTRAV